MNDLGSAFRRMYFSEVLGIKYYLCSKSLYEIRSLRSSLPCQSLVLLFKSPSLSEKVLLKKILNSVEIFEYTVLEIKDSLVLNELFLFEEKSADFIFCFGGESLLKQFPFEKVKDHSDFFYKVKLFKNKPNSFLHFFSLGELDGNSPEVINKKRKVWKSLKTWKKQFSLEVFSYK